MSSTSALTNEHQQMWRSVEWILFAIWLVDAALVMTRHHVGFFTNYAADITMPAWLYVIIRARHPSSRIAPLRFLASRPPGVIATLVFLASAATEVSQYFWPRGLFPGTFDPLDIVAYGAGVGLCFLADMRWPITPLARSVP